MSRPKKRPDPDISVPPRDRRWRLRARCNGEPVDLFFSVLNEDGTLNRYRTSKYQKQAKALCNECPVRLECLRWAIAHQPDGVAGGETARARRALRKLLHLPEPELRVELRVSMQSESSSMT